MAIVNITKLKRYSEVVDGTSIEIPKLTIIQNPDYWMKVINQIHEHATKTGLTLKHSNLGQQGVLQNCDKGDYYLLEYSKSHSDIQDADIIK